MRMAEDTRLPLRQAVNDNDTKAAPVVRDDGDDLVVVEDPAGRRSFHGKLVTRVSTRAGTAPRWTDLELYRVTDAEGGYAIANVGRSVLYHRPGSPCNLGTMRRVGDLPDDEYGQLIAHDMVVERWPGDPKALPPCDPGDLDDLGDDDMVSVEINLPGITKAQTAADLISKLHQERRSRDGGITVFLSEPAQRLLREAADRDPAIAAEMQKPRPL